MMRKEFEKRSGIKVAMTVKSTGETLAQIRAEKDNPRADVWWGGGAEQYLQAAELGLLEAYKSPALGKLHPWARAWRRYPDIRSIGIYAGTLGIVWNTEQLAKRKLPEPKCWADLLKPDYKGEVQMSHAATSGTSYTFLATLVQLMGEEKAFDLPEEAARQHEPVSALGRGADAQRGDRGSDARGDVDVRGSGGGASRFSGEDHRALRRHRLRDRRDGDHQGWQRMSKPRRSGTSSR